MLKLATAAALVAGVAFSMTAAAQQPIYYPAKGQSPDRLNKDRGECQVWAQQNTGIDPVALASAPPTAKVETGPAVGGGERLKGAARGAVVGEVLGGHGGEGAVVGAMAGGARARKNQAERNKASQQEATAARNTTINTYNRAAAACMEGRGYTVK